MGRWTIPLLAVLAGLLLAGCGGGEQAATGTTDTETGATTTTGGETTSVKVFFFRNAALVPVTVDVPKTTSVARAALERLLEGPPSGYETAVPSGTELDAVTVADEVAQAAFSRELGTPTRSAQAQIVSTLTQFPTVEAATISVEGEGAVPLEDGTGTPIAGPAASDDYVDLTSQAPIFVREPARDSSVTSPVHASGTANVFEATFQVEVWSGDEKLRTQTITATSGSGTRGTWKATIELPPGPARLVFYEPSAEDGRPLHTTPVALTVE
jgi:hypothetical protein